MNSREVTTLLGAWTDGDLGARDELMALVYGELHRRGGAYLAARAWLYTALKGDARRAA